MSLSRRVLRRPMLHVVGNGSKPHDPMTLELYPEGNSSFSLYEDDGVTRQHELGYFSSVDITMCDCPPLLRFVVSAHGALWSPGPRLPTSALTASRTSS